MRFNRPVYLLYSLCLLLLLISSANAQVAKNVILMVGDGMGYEHVKSGSYYLTGSQGSLCFEPYHKCGVVTSCLGGGVTDSAAAGSAMATGIKTARNYISQNTDGTVNETILEKAKQLGKSTGLVTTKSITDATPAAFGAHEPSRNNFYNIGNDYLQSSRPDVIFGAGDPSRGGSYFFSASHVAYAQSSGYQLVYNYAQMSGLSPAANRVLGLLGGSSLTYEYDRAPDNPEPHLSQMTTKALDILSRDVDGFFIMVESAQIDMGSHANHLQRTVGEVVEFHNAVQVALNWIAGRNDTLLIITADHETGALSVTNQGAGVYPLAVWGSVDHSGANVPFYTTGVGADIVNSYIKNGQIDNTDVYKVMYAAMVPPNSPASDVKNQPDGTAVRLEEYIVTAGTDEFSSFFYVEKADRSSGIRVSSSTTQVRAGDLVDVSGIISTADGERVITNATVTVHSSNNAVPGSLGMSTRSVGGGRLNLYTAGVNGGIGTHNTGLVVRIFGKVTKVDPVSKRFYVDDGCGLAIDSIKPGIEVRCDGLVTGNNITLPSEGSYVNVTGISSKRVAGDIHYRAIKPRKNADVVILSQ